MPIKLSAATAAVASVSPPEQLGQHEAVSHEKEGLQWRNSPVSELSTPFFLSFFVLCARSGAVTGLAVKNLGHRQQTETPSVAVMLSRNQ